MKSIFNKTGTMLLLFLLCITVAPAQRNCDKRESSSDICPIKINGVQVFDRCFGNLPLDDRDNAVGDAACNALRDANKLKNHFERSAQSQINEMKAEVTAFVQAVTKDAVNEDALKKYREANALMKEVDDEIKKLLNDPKFGVNGRMKKLRTFFSEQAANLVAIGGIAVSFGEAAGKTLPAAGEVTKIAGEMTQIAASLTNASTEAKKQFETITKAVDSITKDIQRITALNGSDVIAAGTSLATAVGPFTTSCASCAAVISTSVAGLNIGGVGGTAAAAACPESAGISCIATAAGGIVAATAGVIGNIAANSTCQEVVAGMTRMNEYINSITKFITSVTSLVNNIQSNLDRTERSVAALNKLAVQLGQTNSQSVKNIGTAFNNIADYFEAGAQVLEDKTLPAINKLGNTMLKDLAVNTKDLVDCYKKYTATAGLVGDDVVEAAGDLAIANLTLLDAKKMFENVVDQSEKGADAAEKFIKDKKKALDSRANDLNKALFGVNIGAVDLGKTVITLTAIAGGNNPVRFLTDKATAAIDLAGDYVDMALQSLNEAKKSFLNLNAFKAGCRQKTNEALSKATSAKKALDLARSNPVLHPIALAELTITNINLQQIKPIKKISRTTLKN